jgi:hypothetical protein
MRNYKMRIEMRKEYMILLIIEIAVLIALLSFFIKSINGGVGSPNATVTTYLNVGTSPPEILRVSINSDSSVTLNANSTALVYCTGLVVDYNNQTNLANVTAVLFANTSTYGAIDANSSHYTNVSCNISNNYSGVIFGRTDDIYTAIANCTLWVHYYALPVRWNCSLLATDLDNLQGENSSTTLFNELMAIGLPSTMSYGTVNATYVSDENITNVSNAGNVNLNLSLKGWAVNQGDGLAMNCTFGSNKNISIVHEKYNLSESNPGTLTLAQTAANYTNLSSTAAIKKFSLDFRRNDTYDDATNATYWRVYVPLGVAGTCQGNIQFGATRAAGS